MTELQRAEVPGVGIMTGQQRAVGRDTTGQQRAVGRDTTGQQRTVGRDTTGQQRGVGRDTTGQQRVMTESQRDELDFRQNVSIALLAVLAVALFARTELFHLGWEMIGSNFPAISEAAAPEQQTETVPDTLSVPLRFVATGVYGGVYGRWANLDTDTGKRPFRAVRRLFADALADSQPFDEIPQETFLLSICGTSLYCDFLTPLPLSVLAGLADAASADERPVRAMALAREKGTIFLCLWDGAGGYSRRASTISRRELDELVGEYELGNGVFALDLGDAYRDIAPLSLFPDETPAPAVYAAAAGLPDTAQLLTAFGFNPLTKSRYTEANGTEVIMEGGRSVRIRANGNIYYQTGERGELYIESASEIPTGWEAVKECAALLNGILLPQGFTEVCPLEVRRQDNLMLIRFGYVLDGIPVFHNDGGAAAVVALDGRRITSLELRPRRYTATETASLLLPLEQALGIAERHPGDELCLGYQDTGSARLSAQWFAAPVADNGGNA